jgi:hypothetical protein
MFVNISPLEKRRDIIKPIPYEGNKYYLLIGV